MAVLHLTATWALCPAGSKQVNCHIRGIAHSKGLRVAIVDSHQGSESPSPVAQKTNFVKNSMGTWTFPHHTLGESHSLITTWVRTHLSPVPTPDPPGYCEIVDASCLVCFNLNFLQ